MKVVIKAEGKDFETIMDKFKVADMFTVTTTDFGKKSAELKICNNNADNPDIVFNINADGTVSVEAFDCNAFK